MKSIDPLVKQQFQGQYLANAIAAGGMPKYVCDSLCDILQMTRMLCVLLASKF